MSKRFPDLEIYIKRVDPANVITWLESRFEVLKTTPDKKSIHCDLASDGALMQCVISEKAAKGGYVSVWFKPNNSPWETDKHCAEEAFRYFGSLEVRCSTGSWEGDDERGWLRFTADGMTTINWF